MYDWMTEKQKEDFESACLIIDSIQNAKEFYQAMKILEKYDFDSVATARLVQGCYNSIHFNNRV